MWWGKQSQNNRRQRVTVHILMAWTVLSVIVDSVTQIEVRSINSAKLKHGCFSDFRKEKHIYVYTNSTLQTCKHTRWLAKVTLKTFIYSQIRLLHHTPNPNPGYRIDPVQHNISSVNNDVFNGFNARQPTLQTANHTLYLDDKLQKHLQTRMLLVFF